MNKLAVLLAFTVAAFATPSAAQTDQARWAQRAGAVTITRDSWGIPHVRGATDADVVFGAMYAQAEDDFNRVEANFITSQGRTAEAVGESAIYADLRMKLFIDPDSMKVIYAKSPAWLQTLMVAWADGLNFYLARHPAVKPRVITKFEPWMALTFSEGSIGNDIDGVNVSQLQAFYGNGPVKIARMGPGSAFERAALAADAVRAIDDAVEKEPSGSNGMAVSPKNTKAGRALLLINPHTSFFFREELQMTSDEGLDAYGASTWGQFFIYQGFNRSAGWMHTTSAADRSDEFLETVSEKNGAFFYKVGTDERPLTPKVITVPYKTASGMAEKKFTVYYTHFGPIVRSTGGKWVAIRIMQEPLKALTQSYTRTKAKNLAEFRKTMDLLTNSSNNTLFADADGNVAYLHANFIPRRDPKFDWTRPVDGSDPASEWKGLLSFDEAPNVLNPASGWVYNSNDWPWAAAGPSSPKQSAFPPYVDNGVESHRGRHAVMVMQDKKDFTIQGLRDAAYDSYLPGFEKSVPALVKAWDDAPAANPLKAKLAEQVKLLRAWDLRWSEASIPTSLAIFYGTEANRLAAGGRGRRGGPAVELTSDQQLQALDAACAKLTADFGKCNTPWGDINRFQRLNAKIESEFDDSAPSTAVGFPSATWGSLASFGARQYPNTKKWYGTSGNSFVAVVEFGKDSVRARAVTAGGLNSVIGSPHFNDQGARYATGDLREVYFYPNQLKGHTERVYQPGKEK
ncbi:MAG: penicillin acylase family protein [Gemmatimonadetes bacterium]|nr:penicillin acylase family protein [Gemmatimonadota bacterium]